MNKKEFKELYAAARLIRGAAYAKGVNNTQGESIAWGICYDTISAMHPASSYAVWGWSDINTSTIYPISTNKWAIAHNTHAFGAVKCRGRGTL